MRRYIKMLVLKSKWRKKHVRFPMSSQISMGAQFEGYNRIGTNSRFVGRMGLGSYIGRECAINASIGRFCSIADYVCTIGGSHPTSKFVSTNPAFYSTEKTAGLSYVQQTVFKEHEYALQDKYTVEIGNDVWIGHGARILQGVHIGDGAIIGAGALVTKDVAPYTIVGGVPAKVIRKRFEDAQIEKLMQIQWWNKDEAWFKQNAHLFSDVQLFIESVGNG